MTRQTLFMTVSLFWLCGCKSDEKIASQLRAIPATFVTTGPNGDLIAVSSNSTKFDDSSMQLLKGCTSLESLSLLESGVTDEGMLNLTEKPRLRVLAMPGARISDRSLEVL